MADGVVVVGGGPAGLAAAVELRRRGVGPVRVLERELEAGGIPRHSDHSGFGVRDLRRVMSGPAYAERYRELAAEAGAELITETIVTGIEHPRTPVPQRVRSGGGATDVERLELTGPNGRRELGPDAVLLATGCRERPRSARLVPGSRPAGVMTTSTLQQLVHLRGERVGRRAVIVGAEHVSFSAIATLAHGGARVAGLVTELPRHQSLAAFRVGAAVRYRAPVWSRTALSAIRGERRVEEVELTDLDTGATKAVECDLVIFTADWIPDHELAVMAGCGLDPGTLGPPFDGAMRTPVPGVFAAGNLLHPAETADVCALDGRHAAASIEAYLEGTRPEAGSGDVGGRPSHLEIRALAPLRWVAPNLIPAGEAPDPPRRRFLLRSSEFLRAPRLEVEQAGRPLWSGRLRRLVPGRSAHIPSSWAKNVDSAAGPITISVK